MKRVFNDAYAILFSDLLFESICCGYSFELPQLVEAIQMSTHNIYFYKVDKSTQMSTHNICFYKEVDKSTLAVI